MLWYDHQNEMEFEIDRRGVALHYKILVSGINYFPR